MPLGATGEILFGGGRGHDNPEVGSELHFRLVFEARGATIFELPRQTMVIHTKNYFPLWPRQ